MKYKLKKLIKGQTGADAKDKLGNLYTKRNDGVFIRKDNKQSYIYNPISKTFNIHYDDNLTKDVLTTGIKGKHYIDEDNTFDSSLNESYVNDLNSDRYKKRIEKFKKNKNYNALKDVYSGENKIDFEDKRVVDYDILEYQRRKYGNPKINMNVSNMAERNIGSKANYDNINNVIAVENPNALIDEYSHSSEMSKNNYFTNKIKEIEDWIKSPYYSQETYDKGSSYLWGKGQYDTLGTEEYEAHKIREPKMYKEYFNNVSKKYLPKRQSGGQGLLVKMESKEVYKSPDGNIMRVSDNAPTHDDGILLNGNKISKATYNEGGVILPAESVLSATHENRDEDDDSYGLVDEIIKIKPKELNQYANVLGFKNIKSNKAVSPSKAFELLRNSKLKEADKLLKPKRELFSDNYTKASVKSNEVLANTLPTDEDIYDMLFEMQESKKAYLNTRQLQKGKI